MRKNQARHRLRRLAATAMGVAVLLGARAACAQAGAAKSPWGGAAPWAHVDHPEGESTVVRELLVIKRLPGPALWKVSRGDSQVVVLGALTPLPHLLAWDTGQIQHALGGASVLLMPPRPKVGLLDAMAFMLNKGALQLPRGQTLAGVLPPPERRRFLGLMQTIHKRPEDYARWKPAVAGFILIGDFRRAAGLSDAKPGSTVAKLAEADRVPIKYIGDFQAAPYVKTVAAMSTAQNLACFDAALDDIDREAAHAPAAAKAWANADLKAVRQTYSVSVFERCLMQVPSVQNLVERGTNQGVAEIEATLNRPGRAVAVIDLNFLLRANGVLDRLKAKGDNISVPQE